MFCDRYVMFGGGNMFMGLIALALFALLVFEILKYFKKDDDNKSKNDSTEHREYSSRVLDIAEEQYALGNISRKQFEEIKEEVYSSRRGNFK